MHLRHLFVLFYASSSLCQTNGVPATGENLSSALKGVTYPVRVTEEADLAATGGMLITDAINQARFVLIGESHFSRETPKLAVLARPSSLWRRNKSSA